MSTLTLYVHIRLNVIPQLKTKHCPNFHAFKSYPEDPEVGFKEDNWACIPNFELSKM